MVLINAFRWFFFILIVSIDLYKEIKRDIIKEKYNVDVSSTHIIAAIGKFKTRRALANNTGLLKAAKEYLSTFKDDIDHAFYWLHQVKGKV